MGSLARLLALALPLCAAADNVQICGFDSTDGCAPVSSGGLFGAIFPFVIIIWLVWAGVATYLCCKDNDMDASKLCSRRSPLPQLPTLSPPHTVSEDLNMTNPASPDHHPQPHPIAELVKPRAHASASVTELVAQRAANGPAHRAPAPAVGWECPACTYMNQAGAQTCQLCASARADPLAVD